MSKILADDELAEGINSLNSKQKEVFSVVHKWSKDYIKRDGHNNKPIHIFLSDSGATSKSHLVKINYDAISKTLLYHYKYPETGISAVNKGWNQHSFCSWN